MRRLVGLVVVAVALAGCGTADDAAQVRRAATTFLGAYAGHDGSTACAQLSPSLRAQLVKDQQVQQCAEGVLQLGLHPAAVRQVRVYATSAVVQSASGETMFFGRGSQGWRIDAVGCYRKDPGPLECKEQS